MDLKRLYHVPKELGEPDLLLAHENTVLIQYERGGAKRHSGIQFEGIAAFQVRALRCIKPWQRETYYEIVEVFGDPWKEDVLKDVSDQYRGYVASKHHYAICGSNDCYEFIADKWKLLPEQDGWQD